MKKNLLILLAGFAICAMNAQTPPRPTPVISPEVHADHTVTFRVRSTTATNVSVSGEMPGGTQSLSKDEHGVWSLTLGPLTPNIYSYSIIVDGFRTIDPLNAKLKPEITPGSSVFEIGGEPPLLHDFQEVPHGTVRVLDYESKSLGKLRQVRVYTPPGYDQSGRTRYPVLYLFHGSGDTEATWTEFGHAQFILDNLLAQGKIKPMILVMPNGHATLPRPENTNATLAVKPSTNGNGTLQYQWYFTGTNAVADARARNTQAFEMDLLNDVVPLVEGSYRVKKGPENHAIIGLSMGGGQSLGVGLNHLDQFAWVGGMSSSVPEAENAFAAILKDPKATNKKIKLLWFACGKDDSLLARNKNFDEILTQHGIEHQFVVSDGGHAWPVWRNYLAEFAPLIFR